MILGEIEKVLSNKTTYQLTHRFPGTSEMSLGSFFRLEIAAMLLQRWSDPSLYPSRMPERFDALATHDDA